MLGTTELSTVAVDETLGVVLKYQEDIARVRAEGVERLAAG